MITAIVLTCTFTLVSLIATVIGNAIHRKQALFGRPPIHVVFFILAKVLVVINLVFLFFRCFGVEVPGIFTPSLGIQIVALVLLALGTVILFLTVVKLNKDLIFGLSSSESHTLQTTGIYAFSRHPFYLGFLCVLAASCLLMPHIINIAAFLGAWLIHHVIMIREERFLISQYGETYRAYAGKVNRYVTLKV